MVASDTDGNLKPPKHLWPDAKWLWKRVILELKACGLLTHLDLETLEVYCQAYAVYRAADRELRKQGLIFKYWGKGKIKGEQAHAAWTIERQAWLVMNRYGQDLGLSPAARTRIQLFKSKQEDSDERLFG